MAHLQFTSNKYHITKAFLGFKLKQTTQNIFSMYTAL